MRGCGEERVIFALLSLPRLNAKALLTVLPYQIKKNQEDAFYKEYISEVLRYSGKAVAGLTGGEYMPKSHMELLHPKKEMTAGEIVEHVLAKIG